MRLGMLLLFGFLFGLAFGNPNKNVSHVDKISDDLKHYRENIKLIVEMKSIKYFVTKDNRTYIFDAHMTKENQPKFGIDPSITNITAPIELTELRGQAVIKMCEGGSFTTALTSNGTVWSWGIGFYGQLGKLSNKTYRPIRNPDVSNVTDFTCIKDGIVILTNNGTVKYWGRNDRKQITDNRSPAYSNVPVTKLYNATKIFITSQAENFLAFLKNGTQLRWGPDYGSQPRNISSSPAKFSGRKSKFSSRCGYYNNNWNNNWNYRPSYQRPCYQRPCYQRPCNCPRVKRCPAPRPCHCTTPRPKPCPTPPPRHTTVKCRDGQKGLIEIKKEIILIHKEKTKIQKELIVEIKKQSHTKGHLICLVENEKNLNTSINILQKNSTVLTQIVVSLEKKKKYELKILMELNMKIENAKKKLVQISANVTIKENEFSSLESDLLIKVNKTITAATDEQEKLNKFEKQMQNENKHFELHKEKILEMYKLKDSNRIKQVISMLKNEKICFGNTNTGQAKPKYEQEASNKETKELERVKIENDRLKRTESSLNTKIQTLQQAQKPNCTAEHRVNNNVVRHESSKVTKNEIKSETKIEFHQTKIEHHKTKVSTVNKKKK